MGAAKRASRGRLGVLATLSLAFVLLAASATASDASGAVASIARADGTSRPLRSRRALLRAASVPRVDWTEWRYRSNDELAAALDDLHAGACAGLSALTSIGRSAKGEDIRVLEISAQPGRVQPKPSFVLIGNMHGDEPTGREFILRFARLVCLAASRARPDRTLAAGLVESSDVDVDASLVLGTVPFDDDADVEHADAAAALARDARLFLLPTVNPDGFAAKSRANANGRDLNRDFPDQFDHPGMPDDFPSRQPETAAVMRWSRSVNATAALNFHEGALVANYPWDGTPDKKTRYAESPDDAAFRRLARAYADAHPTMHDSAEFDGGVTNGARWYPLRGGMQDWHYAQTGTMDVTIETNVDKWPDEALLRRLWREHRPAVFAAAAAATRQTLRGIVVARRGAAERPVPGASLAVEGEGLPFAANELGYFARPVGGPEAKGSARVSLAASAPGYAPAKVVVDVDAEDGAVVHVALEPLGADVDADVDGVPKVPMVPMVPRARTDAPTMAVRERGEWEKDVSVSAAAATTTTIVRPPEGEGRRGAEPEAVFGAVGFVLLAWAAVVRSRRATRGLRREAARVEGV